MSLCPSGSLSPLGADEHAHALQPFITLPFPIHQPCYLPGRKIQPSWMDTQLPSSVGSPSQSPTTSAFSPLTHVIYMYVICASCHLLEWELLEARDPALPFLVFLLPSTVQHIVSA